MINISGKGEEKVYCRLQTERNIDFNELTQQKENVHMSDFVIPLSISDLPQNENLHLSIRFFRWIIVLSLSLHR